MKINHQIVNDKMVRENKTSDNSIRRMILAGELIALNAALLTMSFVYQSLGNITTPHYKRLMLLMTLVYVLCDLQSQYHIHDRFVRGDQLLRSTMQSTTLFILLSLMVMWVFRWPLMTWDFMLPFYGFIIIFVFLYRWGLRNCIKWYRSHGHNTMIVIFVGKETGADGTGIANAGCFNEYDFDGTEVRNFFNLLNEFVA